VQVSTEVGDVEGAEFCIVRVRDTGAGIPAELREDIFNPFFTTKAKGTGLGLAVSHQIVKEHGGFINVESSPGEGAEFTVHLPTVQEIVQHDFDEQAKRGDKSRRIA
jgi:signal transduction histidine kinase